MSRPKTPNPRYHLRAGRAQHVESGTPVTITPLNMDDEGEHWTDANKRKLDEVMDVLGIEVADGRQLAALIGGPSFMLDALLALARRVKALEGKNG